MVDRGKTNNSKPPHLFVVPKTAPPLEKESATSEAENMLYLRLSPIDRLIGREIEKKRKYLGMSQNELSGHLRIQAKVLDNYENGRDEMTTETLVEIGRVLNCSPIVFFRTASLAIQLDIDEMKQLYGDADVIRKSSENSMMNDDMKYIISSAEKLIKVFSLTNRDDCPVENSIR